MTSGSRGKPIASCGSSMAGRSRDGANPMKTSLKLAVKVLGRRKFFTFISLFGISMTLLVLMIATAVLDNVFAPHTPESRFDRVLCIYRITQTGRGETESTEPGYAFLQRFVKPLHDIEAFGMFTNGQTI